MSQDKLTCQISRKSQKNDIRQYVMRPTKSAAIVNCRFNWKSRFGQLAIYLLQPSLIVPITKRKRSSCSQITDSIVFTFIYSGRSTSSYSKLQRCFSYRWSEPWRRWGFVDWTNRYRQLRHSEFGIPIKITRTVLCCWKHPGYLPIYWWCRQRCYLRIWCSGYWR